MKLFLFLLKNDKKKFKFSSQKQAMRRNKKKEEKHPKNEDGKSFVRFSFDKHFFWIQFYFNFNLKLRLMDLMEHNVRNWDSLFLVLFQELFQGRTITKKVQSFIVIWIISSLQAFWQFFLLFFLYNLVYSKTIWKKRNRKFLYWKIIHVINISF